MSLVAVAMARRQDEQMRALDGRCADCGDLVHETNTSGLCRRCYSRAWSAKHRATPREEIPGKTRRRAVRQATLDELLTELRRRGLRVEVQIGGAA